VRLTDFWERMDSALGAGYARSWASDFHLGSLGGLTVDEAIAQGIDTLIVWRAVHEVLRLEEKYR